jgi:hypothetical protein
MALQMLLVPEIASFLFSVSITFSTALFHCRRCRLAIRLWIHADDPCVLVQPRLRVRWIVSRPGERCWSPLLSHVFYGTRVMSRVLARHVHADVPCVVEA